MCAHPHAMQQVASMRRRYDTEVVRRLTSVVEDMRVLIGRLNGYGEGRSQRGEGNKHEKIVPLPSASPYRVVYSLDVGIGLCNLSHGFQID